jgi:hypothetical protein
LNPLDRDEGFQITSSLSSLPGLFLAQHPQTFTKADIDLRRCAAAQCNVCCQSSLTSNPQSLEGRSLIRSERSASAALIADTVCGKVLTFDPIAAT